MCFNTVCLNASQIENFRKALKIAVDSCILLLTRHHPFGGSLLGDDSSIHHLRGDVLPYLYTFSDLLIYSSIYDLPVKSVDTAKDV